jgi:lipid A disaccharide synthetase
VAREIMNNSEIVDFPVIFTIAENTRIINEYLQELIALEWIQNNRSELAGDSIARREVEDRKQLLHSYLETQLNKILVESVWFVDGNTKTMRLNELT